MDIKSHKEVLEEEKASVSTMDKALIRKFENEFTRITLTSAGGLIKNFAPKKEDCDRVVQLLSKQFSEKGWQLDVMQRNENYSQIINEINVTSTIYDIMILPDAPRIK